MEGILKISVPRAMASLADLFSSYPEILIATASFIFVFLYYKTSRKCAIPTNWPVLGMLPGLVANIGNFHGWLTDLLRETGCSFQFLGPWFLGMDFLLTCDPANVNHVFNVNFSNYPKGDEFSEIFDILGEGIFNADDESWRSQRKKAHGAMSSVNFRAFVAKCSRGKVENALIPLMTQAAEQGEGFRVSRIRVFLLMGAVVSSALGPEVEDWGPHEIGLGDLPESCVAEVMLRLDPAEICRLARLSRAFRGAATADFVWETKLPVNYRYLIGKALGESDSKGLGFLTKKEIYAQLCRRNPFDQGTKEFWMEKKSGGICVSISSKALAITGIDDRRYWNYIPTKESRFHTVAYLQQVWWLEVAGEIDFCFPPGTYSLYFRLHLGRASKWLGRRICCLEHVHGWDIKPVKFQLRTSDGQHAVSECHLDEPGNWNRYHVGDFVVEKSNVLTKVKFSMTQIDCTHTKGGLCVDSVLIYPKGYR